jgi:hypothetical protein
MQRSLVQSPNPIIRLAGVSAISGHGGSHVIMAVWNM